MAASESKIVNVAVTLQNSAGMGEPTAPGGKGKGKPPPAPSLGIRKSVGGAAKAVAGKIPGGGAASAAVGKIPKPDPKLMSMAGESLKHAGATASGAGKAAGISAGLSSILKQSQLFTGVIGTIFQIVGMLVDVIIMPFMPIIIPVIKMFAWTVPKVMWLTQKLQIGIQAVVDGIGWFFANIDNAFKWVIEGSWLSTMTDGIWSGIMAVWNKISWWSGPLHPFKAMFEAIKGIINIIITVVKGAWGIAKTIIQGIWNLIKLIFSVYKAIFKLYFEVIKAVINLYITIFKTAWGIAKSVIEGIWGFIQTAYSGIKEFISGVFEGVKSFFSGLWEPFKSGLDSAIEFVRGIPATIWGYIQSIWEIIKGWAANFINNILLIKDFAVGIFQKIKDFFNSASSIAKSWVLGRITTIKSFFTGLWDKAKDIIGLIKEKVLGIFEKINTIREKIISVLEIINPLSWIPKIVEKIKAIIPTPGELVDNIPGVGTVKNVASKLKFWQHGAIVSKPTLGVAGESGPEIIAPLKVLGTLKFLPPIFQGIKAIAEMIPRLGLPVLLKLLFNQGGSQRDYLASISSRMADIRPIRLELQNIYSYLPILNTSIRAVESAETNRPAVNVTVINQTAERIDTSQSEYQSNRNRNQSIRNQNVLLEEDYFSSNR